MTTDDDAGEGGPMIRWGLVDTAARAFEALPGDYASRTVAAAVLDLTAAEWSALQDALIARAELED